MQRAVIYSKNQPFFAIFPGCPFTTTPLSFPLSFHHFPTLTSHSLALAAPPSLLLYSAPTCYLSNPSYKIDLLTFCPNFIQLLFHAALLYENYPFLFCTNSISILLVNHKLHSAGVFRTLPILSYWDLNFDLKIDKKVFYTLETKLPSFHQFSHWNKITKLCKFTTYPKSSTFFRNTFFFIFTQSVIHI